MESGDNPIALIKTDFTNVHEFNFVQETVTLSSIKHQFGWSCIPKTSYYSIMINLPVNVELFLFVKKI